MRCHICSRHPVNYDTCCCCVVVVSGIIEVVEVEVVGVDVGPSGCSACVVKRSPFDAVDVRQCAHGSPVDRCQAIVTFLAR